jgi:polysaccharide pyruvyl transferase WcaK-like protein
VSLPARAPAGQPDWLPDWLAQWTAPGRDFPVAGLNVSGLLALDAEPARAAFGLACRHDLQALACARAILDHDPRLRLVLVPHVHRDPSDRESDLAAALGLQARLREDYPGRVGVVPGRPDAMELKWLLSRLCWFAGARMHATIGAFSSGTPTLGLGYSDKAAGVFAQCGIAEHVADLRRLDAPALVAAVGRSLERRADTRRALALGLPALLARAEAQMDAIAAQIGG